MVKVLLENGAKVDIKSDQCTPLSKAAQKGNLILMSSKVVNQLYESI